MLPRELPSLRRRIALGVGLAVGVSLGGLFVLIDTLVDRELYRRFDAGIAGRANAIAAYLGAHVAGAEELSRWMPEFREEGHTDFFQAWDAQGRVIARSESSQSLDLAQPRRVDTGEFRHFDLALPDGHRGRAVARRYELAAADERGSIVLVVAEEREQLDELEDRIHLIFVGGVLLALLVTVLLATSGARRALAPLDRIAERIARIRPGAPRETLVEPGLPAELQPLAQKFDQVVEQLIATLDRERRFAQDLAHELRTPVAELRAIAEINTGLADPAALQRALRELGVLGAEMERTVEALLTLARFDAGLDVSAPEPLDLAGLLRQMCERLEEAAAARGLRFDAMVPAECWVQADAAMLERLLATLFANALDHAPPGGVVRLRLHDGPAPLLEIANAAPALGEDDLPRLGSRFFRAVDPVAGAPVHHAGLGLALARALARAHGLRLEFALAGGELIVRIEDFQPLDALGAA
ncbi:MAG: sensor histidine kinase N-terminal domain-containing protein [Gammaproteobacteria bacterium]|jgi:two-component system sensor histidine kinase QseC|nr:sensor histidine kinase N-terminal domain-containing protein [Gammaproteobacteria bacterium]MBK7169086.1 sensor histidine kinase N-terminal domain-containing protein [Gammaproteobacteria bacterium]MBK7520068.1 sensor histidine kinase N-terminal domain-containing protein [Gammaproteobacteria bacterium]MBK7730671.1 sensor histidine kinase N-terminal domain-containing protein [Gammaproteobacteria bacterium]MBK8306216.1 sensor histidine kinase N-terminal domain-containing protein [Gammaproteobac